MGVQWPGLTSGFVANCGQECRTLIEVASNRMRNSTIAQPVSRPLFSPLLPLFRLVFCAFFFAEHAL